MSPLNRIIRSRQNPLRYLWLCVIGAVFIAADQLYVKPLVDSSAPAYAAIPLLVFAIGDIFVIAGLVVPGVIAITRRFPKID